MQRQQFRFICAMAAIASMACDDTRRVRQETHTETVVQVQTGVHADDLDLQAVVQALTDKKVKTAGEVEQFINATSGVNNVDADGDDQVDPIGVQEVRNGSNYAFDLVAQTTSTNGKETVPVATINFTVNQTTNTVDVSGGYASHVGGYHDHHYHASGLSMSDVLIMSWLMSPRPMYMYPAYGIAPWYAPRPVMMAPALRSSRTTYQSQTTVSPVRKTTRPATFTGPTASKTPSRFAMPRSTPSGDSISARRNAAPAYQQRNTSQAQRPSSAFGGTRPSSPAPSYSRPAAPPSRPSYSPPPSRPSPSRGWGGGGSTSRSSSFGGGRRK